MGEYNTRFVACVSLFPPAHQPTNSSVGVPIHRTPTLTCTLTTHKSDQTYLSPHTPSRFAQVRRCTVTGRLIQREREPRCTTEQCRPDSTNFVNGIGASERPTQVASLHSCTSQRTRWMHENSLVVSRMLRWRNAERRMISSWRLSPLNIQTQREHLVRRIQARARKDRSKRIPREMTCVRRTSRRRRRRRRHPTSAPDPIVRLRSFMTILTTWTIRLLVLS